MSTATGYATTGASFFVEFIPILSISLSCGWPFDSQSILCPPSDLFVLVAKVLPDALLVFRGTYNVEKGATNSEVCVIGDRAEYYIVRDAYGFFSFHCRPVFLIVRQDSRFSAPIFGYSKRLDIVLWLVFRVTFLDPINQKTYGSFAVMMLQEC